MGMTIDEIIQDIEVIKAQAEWDYPLDWQIVLDEAIEIMRKYYKIQEIVSSKTTRLSYEDGFRQIKEVLEDGNNN